jgi:hypothetical protein
MFQTIQIEPHRTKKELKSEQVEKVVLQTHEEDFFAKEN